MSDQNTRGLGRFFKGPDDVDAPQSANPDAIISELQRQNATLQGRISELENTSGRASFVDLDEDQLTQIAAEDAAVIIRAARARAAKLVELRFD